MNAQVQLYSTALSVLSIPRENYWLFSQAVLQLLHHVADKLGDTNPENDLTSSSEDGESDSEISRPSTPAYITDHWACPVEPASAELEDPFLHVAFTPVECTVICSTNLIKRFFAQPLQLQASRLFDESYVALQVVTDGLDNKRVLELTEPLSDSVSIFFMTTHFADIILVPETEKMRVTGILRAKGYDVVLALPLEETAPVPADAPSVKVEDRTFALFALHGIKPTVSKAKLLLTGARPGRQNAREVILLAAVALAAHNPSSNSFVEYFALTKTTGLSVSLLLPKSARLRQSLGFGGKNKFIGSDVDSIIPISVDLTRLPVDSKGIVAGVASRLLNSEAVQGANSGDIGVFEMSYLSMGLSGVVMIPEEWLASVRTALRA